MQVFNELIKVSKESILNKHFEIDMVAYEKLSESEKESVKNLFPTDDEKNFMQVFKSTAPQLARLQRKMSVCLDVEVLDYDFNCITFTYSGNIYEIQSCKNAYKICQALEKSTLEAVYELGKQGCIRINEKLIGDIKQDKTIEVDELMLIQKVTDKFFFQTFIA